MPAAVLLASRSPRRRELLARAGIPFETLDVDVDESVADGQPPEQTAVELALLKARAGAAAHREGLVLGADTVVALGERVLGKPRDRADARAMLQALSGTEHRVLTGVALVDAATGRTLTGYDVTLVRMRPMMPEEIDAYVASGESDDKAGAYAIQQRGDRFVEHREGSWSNVVGLPVGLVRRLLRRASC